MNKQIFTIAFINAILIFNTANGQSETFLMADDQMNNKNTSYYEPLTTPTTKGVRTFKNDFQSPYELSWKTDGIIAGSGLLLNAVALSMDCPCTSLSRAQADSFTHSDVFWFDRSATYKYNKSLRDVSDQLGLFAVVAPLALLADQNMRSDILTIGVMFAETRLFASALPTISKKTVSRYRPYVYNPNVSYEDKIATEPGQSFFASQTTSVFSTAVFIATVYGDYYPDSKYKNWVWAGSLAAASAITLVRYETGIHYTSDLLVGAAVGSAIGYFIPRLHRINKSEKLSIVPVIGNNSYTLNAYLRF